MTTAILVIPQLDEILATGIPALPKGSVIYALLFMALMAVQVDELLP